MQNAPQAPVHVQPPAAVAAPINALPFVQADFWGINDNPENILKIAQEHMNKGRFDEAMRCDFLVNNIKAMREKRKKEIQEMQNIPEFIFEAQKPAVCVANDLSKAELLLLEKKYKITI